MICFRFFLVYYKRQFQFHGYQRLTISNFIVFREFSRAMMFNATFNNISVILWRSVLLVEETGVYGENHRPVTDKLYHIMHEFHILS
jgi:hypothetical protein